MHRSRFARRLLSTAALVAVGLGILTLAGCDLPRDSGSGYDAGSSSGGHHH